MARGSRTGRGRVDRAVTIKQWALGGDSDWIRAGASVRRGFIRQHVTCYIGRTEATVSIIHEGDGQLVVPLGFLPGYRSEFVIAGDAARRRITATVETVPAGMPHGRHIHHRRDEFFFMIEGELDVSLGDEQATVRPNSSVFVPRGVAHSFGNPFDEPARMLAIWVPGDGIHEMYREWERAFPPGASFDMNRFVEIWRTYDTEPA